MAVSLNISHVEEIGIIQFTVVIITCPIPRTAVALFILLLRSPNQTPPSVGIMSNLRGYGKERASALIPFLRHVQMEIKANELEEDKSQDPHRLSREEMDSL